MPIRFLDTETPTPAKAGKIRFLDEGESPGIAKTVSKFARPALEAGGAVLGGLAGAGATSVTVAGVPVGMAAGGALGLAGGKAAADLLDRTMGVKPQIQSVPEAIGETAKNLEYGAVGEATGLGMVAGLGATGTAILKPIIEKARRFKVDITPAESTGSKPWALLESALEKIPFSSGMIQRFRVNQANQLEKAAQGLIEDLAVTGSKETAGTAVQSAIEDKFYKRLKVRDKLFNRLTDKVKPEVKIGVDNLNETAQQLLMREGQLPAQQQDGAIVNYLKGIQDIRQQGLSFQGAKTLRERLNEQIGPMADSPIKKIYQTLKGALDDDLAAFADKEGGGIATAWKKVNSFHGAVKQLADDPNVKGILNKAQPEKIVDSVLSSKSTTQMRLLRKAMPEGAYQKFQGALVNRLFQGGANQNPAFALASNLDKYGGEFLEAALTKPKFDRLKEFAELVSTMKGTRRMADNPSGTAQNVGTMLTIGAGGYGLGNGFILQNPITAAVTVITPPVMAKMYLSDYGRKLIQEGIKVSPQTARAAGIASAISALSKRYQANETKEQKKATPKPLQFSKAMPVYDTTEQAREASKSLPDGQKIMIGGVPAVIATPGRKRGPGAPKPIQFLTSPEGIG